MSTESTPQRREPRAMLALIALATDLPLPTRINFNDGILGLGFDSITEGLPWLAFFGQPQESYVYQGRRYLKDREINQWHGWHVQLAAAEPAVPDAGLDAETTEQLRGLAGCRS